MHLVMSSQGGIFIDVDFDDARLFAQLRFEVLQNWLHHFTRAAPGGEKINQGGYIAFDDICKLFTHDELLRVLLLIRFGPCQLHMLVLRSPMQRYPSIRTTMRESARTICDLVLLECPPRFPWRDTITVSRSIVESVSALCLD